MIKMVQCGQVYIKNETTDKYVKVEDMNEKEYQSNHKPVYEENNMKIRINSLYALAVVSGVDEHISSYNLFYK